jgi:hypothetical protein
MSKLRLELRRKAANLVGLREQELEGGTEGSQELRPPEGARQRLARVRQDFRWEAVEAAPVAGLEPAPEAGQREGLVADSADPLLRLPWAFSLDGVPGTYGVVHADPEDFLRRGRWRQVLLNVGAEDEAQPRSILRDEA